MRSLVKKTDIDFLSHWRMWGGIALLLVVLSLMTLFLKGGLNLGLDFTGGTLIEVSFKTPSDLQQMRSDLESNGLSSPLVQNFGSDNAVLIRLSSREGNDTGLLSSQVMEIIRNRAQERLAPTQKAALQQCIGVNQNEVVDCNVQMRRVEFVGASVGEELIQSGSLAVLYALFGILIYVTLRFEWRYAVGAIVALVHDVAFTLGIFALFGIEFALPVLAAILAVVGYSLNDTIVVYDRIRENFRLTPEGEPVSVINHALNQVLSRTLLTSLTTLMVLVTLLVLGGQVIQSFVIALLIGVVIGTFSSIFVAAPVILLLGASGSDLKADVKAEAHDILE